MLTAILAIGWWWFDGLKAREAAVSAARTACDTEGFLLLDWTVSMTASRLMRNARGRMQLQRAYQFEYTNTGNNRLTGSVVVLGREVVLLNLAQ